MLRCSWLNCERQGGGGGLGDVCLHSSACLEEGGDGGRGAFEVVVGEGVGPAPDGLLLFDPAGRAVGIGCWIGVWDAEVRGKRAQFADDPSGWARCAVLLAVGSAVREAVYRGVAG